MSLGPDRMRAEGDLPGSDLRRMMGKPMGRAVKASILSLAMALGLTACSNDYSVAYVYMATSNTLPHGLINAYQVDYQSGYLYTMPDSPADAGGRDTVKALVEGAPKPTCFCTRSTTSIPMWWSSRSAPTASCTSENTYNTTGSLPVAAAIDAAGKFLYVAFTYQNTANGQALYSPSNPGPGGITIFPINANNTLGTPTTVNVGRNPVGIATSAAGNFVYLIEQDSATNGNLLGFAENPSTGALTALPGQTINAGNVPSTGFASGPTPAGILGDAAGTHLYVTDKTLNQLAEYSIAGNGVPTLVPGGTVSTDGGPMGMAFDLTGKYLYVTANLANALDGYTLSGGLPARSTVAASVQTGNGPTCVTVMGAPSNANPGHAVYLYTSNSLSNNVTGEQLNEKDGCLDLVPGTPFGGSPLPSCVVSAPALPLR